MSPDDLSEATEPTATESVEPTATEPPAVEPTATEPVETVSPTEAEPGSVPRAAAEPVDPDDLEARTQEIGRRLFAGLAQQNRSRPGSSVFVGRALQRRMLAQAASDEHFKTRLFRFVDVYPSLRDSGDVVRHLRSYLDEGGLLPRPLDSLLVRTGERRLPTWAIARLTERGMQRMAGSLIAGRDATAALPTIKRLRRRKTGFTLDILGEACLSEREAEEYERRYLDVLDILPSRAARWSAEPAVDQAPWGELPRVNVSLKLTSLYSQIDPVDFDGSREAVFAALKPFFLKARDAGVFVNIDLERFAYRDLTYAVLTDLLLDDDLRDYPHVGVVVQSYLRDSLADAQDLVRLARTRGTPLTVRLVKGAYWDYETIMAAQEHWPSPVFAEKAQTDAQFELLARFFIDNREWTRPALGTHNIRSMAAALAYVEARGLPSGTLELQMLHGMAEPIRRAVVAEGYRVREYVPVGELIPGMAYLVRRLLENTANESFLRLTFAQEEDQETLLAPPLGAGDAPIDPTIAVGSAKAPETPGAVTPEVETAPEPGLTPFQNEPHADFSRPEIRAAMKRALATIRGSLGREYSLLIGGEAVTTASSVPSVNPADPSEVVGTVSLAGPEEADRALAVAEASFPSWRDTPASERATALFRAAAIMRDRRFELAALEVIEAGKPWREADADVTEAIDFLEYYGREMLRLAVPRSLSDVPGEDDILFYEPRGVVTVIAPWNFPLAIPTGMVSAALVSGNTVVFKPAGPTPVLGYALIRILHEAGIPDAAVGFLPGPGAEIGEQLVSDPRVDMVAFTGSAETGLNIMRKAAPVHPGQRNVKKVVAEMGGKNAIIVDTDADLDAAVEGVVASAFHYAGQKCSACSRVVVLDEVYDQFVSRLTQAAASLKVGDPADPGTKVGPVITAEARDRILGYVTSGKSEATLAFPFPAETDPGTAGIVAETVNRPETVAGPEPEKEDAADSTAGDEVEPTGHPAGDEVEPAAHPAGEQTDARDDGFFVRPHVFTDVPPEAVVAQEEIFGPVLAVLKAHDFDQALGMALGVRYGLTGGLYSRNPAHIERAYREFRVGNLYINRPITGAMVGRQPFGGSRMSGMGSKAGGPDYLLQFMEPRTVTENTVRRGFAPSNADARTVRSEPA